MIKKEELIKEIEKNGMYTVLVKKALKQAEDSHGNQLRDDGVSVLENHVYPITYNLLKRYSGKSFLEDLVVLALLHDTMEDDENFNEKECLKLFNKKICTNVKNLTKDEKTFRSYSGENESLYELLKYFCNKNYIENVNGSNEICKIVKLEDRVNNLQSIKRINATFKDLRYVMETDTLFMSMAKKTKSYDYVPLLQKEIDRLSSY